MARNTDWSQSGGRLILLGFLAWPHGAIAADRDLTAWQEITVLTVSKLEMAVANCGYAIDGKQLDLLLVSADLTLDEAHTRQRSPALRNEIDAVGSAYQADRPGSCARAWDTFGPDGSAHGYLTR